MADMLVDEKASVAALSTRTTLSIDFKKLKEAGFLLTTEPFFRGMLLAIHQYTISKWFWNDFRGRGPVRGSQARGGLAGPREGLECTRRCSFSEQQLWKQKIEVPPEMGRTMYGVLDTTKLLQYGQVFVQYSKDLNKPGENCVVLERKWCVLKVGGMAKNVGVGV